MFACTSVNEKLNTRFFFTIAHTYLHTHSCISFPKAPPIGTRARLWFFNCSLGATRQLLAVSKALVFSFFDFANLFANYFRIINTNVHVICIHYLLCFGGIVGDDAHAHAHTHAIVGILWFNMK